MLGHPLFAVNLENIHDVARILLALYDFILFIPFSNQDDNFTLASSTGSTEALDHTNGGSEAIIRDDQIHISDI
jgi:hypothetical protein